MIRNTRKASIGVASYGAGARPLDFQQLILKFNMELHSFDSVLTVISRNILEPVATAEFSIGHMSIFRVVLCDKLGYFLFILGRVLTSPRRTRSR